MRPGVKVFFHHSARRAQAVLDQEIPDPEDPGRLLFEPYTTSNRILQGAVTTLLEDLMHLEACEKGFSFEEALRDARRKFRVAVSGE